MRITQLTFVAILATLVAGMGCERKKVTPQPGTTQSGDSHSHDDGTSHEHSHGDNDHAAGESHDHGSGPHGGALADWSGGKFHAEFTVNHDRKEATVYILGADAKTAHAIDAAEITLAIKEPKMQVTLQASPQPGDPSGTASCFVGKHDGLGLVQEYEGSISGVDKGTPYSGAFQQEPADSK